MRKIFKILILTCQVVLFTLDCQAFDFSGPHRLTFGPEFYHMRRSREGGSKQKGYLTGVYAEYDRIKPKDLYWACRFHYLRGTIRGKTASRLHIKSRKTDIDVEARLGYTIFSPCLKHFTFTPYVGGGYFEGMNQFVPPSPIPVKLTNCFGHLTGGFLLYYNLSHRNYIGLHFQAKHPIDAKCKVTDDPVFEDSKLKIEDEFCYEVEVPIGLRKCFENRIVDLTATPFFRYRKFGRHKNFPFDYYETRFQIYGSRFTLSIAF